MMQDDQEEKSNSLARGNKEKPPPSKKLRCSDPDLRVVVRSSISNSSTNHGDDDDDDDENKVEEKTYEMYGSTLAGLSKFVDASLANPMRERTTKTIVLEDVSPEIFELALKFQQDPVAARTMTVRDVLQVAEFYDRYEFTGGIQVCNFVLVEYLEKELQADKERNDNKAMMKGKRQPRPPNDLDLLIDVVVLSERCHLKVAFHKGVQYIGSKMCQIDNPFFGPTIFTEEHFKKLQPLMAKDIVPTPLDATKEEIESSLFPRLCVEIFRNRVVQPRVWRVKLSGTGYQGMDGLFEWSGAYLGWDTVDDYDDDDARVVDFSGRPNRVTIEPDDELCGGDWGIILEKKWPEDEEDFEEDPNDPNKIAIFKCPNSSNLHFPPAGPWISMVNNNKDSLAVTNNPKITYDRVIHTCLGQPNAPRLWD